jgi:lipid-binding SYLF domain-containing protein
MRSWVSLPYLPTLTKCTDAFLSPVIRTEEALASFSTHKVTLGSEFAVAAGPYGSGAAVELGIDRSPVLSYVRSRGLYAGVELVAQVFITRTEENEKMYNWPYVPLIDISRTRD